MVRPLRIRSTTTLVALCAQALTACGSSNNNGGPFAESDGGGGQDAATGGSDGGPASDAPTGGNDASEQDAPTSGSFLTIPLDVCDQLSAYGAGINVGSQTFEMVVDTGSTTLGVAGTGCTTCAVTPLYTPGSTATNENQTLTSNFGSGSWTGDVYQDSVAFNALSSQPADLKFASITSQMDFFDDLTFAGTTETGIIGFDVGQAAAPCGTTTQPVACTNGFFDQFIAKYPAVTNEFALQLCDTSGTLWLGGYDSTKTTGAPQYTNFLTSGIDGYYYSVDFESITVAGVTTPVAVASGQFTDSVLDSGTSVLLLGQTTFNALTAAIASTPQFTQIVGADAGGANWFQPVNDPANPGAQSVNCVSGTKEDIDSALPALTFTFGTNPAITVQAPATESYLSYTSEEGQTGYCVAIVGIAQSANSFPLAAIIGAPALKSAVVVFDRANGRAGFAPHAACPAAPQFRKSLGHMTRKIRAPRVPKLGLR
jgi:hypothetical protein